MSKTQDFVVNQPEDAANHIEQLEQNLEDALSRIKLLEFTLTEIYRQTNDDEIREMITTVMEEADGEENQEDR